MRQTNELFVHEVIHKEKLALVGEMAASLMHDLRNPLAGIRLSADLLKMMHAQDEESRRCCEGIDIQCVRIAGMATDLLEVTRGEVQLHLQRVNTADFLEQFRTLNADFISRAAARIVFRTDPAEVEIDTLRVLRLLQNLVTNAVEATLQQADGLVEVEAWVQESRFLLTVKDNGPGLPAKVVENLYKPFSTHGKAGGTGLGMTIVKNVVEAHHGEITYKTGPGQGTSFFVNLPRFTTPPADPPSVPVPAGLNEALDETRSQITRSIALSTRALPRPRQT
jgi:signal transduction histidine kinase